MFIVYIAISVAAAVLLHETGLFVPALVNAVVNLWSLGVGWNFKDDPTWHLTSYGRVVTSLSMLTTLAGLGLLIACFFIE